jgi:hypothetical protein
MGNRPRYDVPPEQYATVIRELIRHQNDVTNHRIMWFLVVQGLLINAYVKRDEEAWMGVMAMVKHEAPHEAAR